MESLSVETKSPLTRDKILNLHNILIDFPYKLTYSTQNVHISETLYSENFF